MAVEAALGRPPVEAALGRPPSLPPSLPVPLWILGVANAPVVRVVDGAALLGGSTLGVGAAKCTPLAATPDDCEVAERRCDRS